MNVFDALSLKGKVAIVTGGSGNLGSAMTHALFEAGADVYVLGRSKTSFDNNKFNTEHIFFLEGDIMSTESIKSCYEKVIAEKGHIDILINNALAIDGGGKLPEEISDEMWAYTADGLTGSVHRCIREVEAHMIKNGGGKIINIASMYGIISPKLSMYDGVCRPFLNPIHYGAMKAAVIQMTKYYGAYLIEKGINVNCITPGTFPSAAVQENGEFVKRLSKMNPANRIGKAEDIKGATLLLSSSASDYIVGQNIIIDGGWTIW